MRLQSLYFMNALKLEIAARAAQMIADSGLDYGSAKRKAALDLCATSSLPKDSLPNNEDVDAALLEHLTLFDPGHASRVQSMREVALELMERLPEFQIYLTGPAWKGICAEHAYVHLQAFHDNAKEVEYALLNLNIAYEAETAPHWRGDKDTEALALLYQRDRKKLGGERIPVLISLYGSDDLRGALKVKVRVGEQSLAARGNREALLARMNELKTVQEKLGS
jgi:hypothetical protein